MVTFSRRDPLSFLTTTARKFGDISSFQIGRERIYLLNHPDYIRDVLTNHYEYFLKGRGNVRIKRFLGEGILLSEGERHRKDRQFLQPAFHRDRLEGYARVALNRGEQMTSAWHDDQVIDVGEQMQRVTLAIVGETLFSADVQSTADEVGRALCDATVDFKAFRLPLARLYANLPFANVQTARQGQARLKQTVLRLLDQRRRSTKDYGDIVSMILHAGTEGEQLTDNQVWDQALTVFIAGYDTLSLALTWTWFLLSQHPDVERKLYEELDDVLRGAQPSFEHVTRLQYTTMVLLESMRMYPPTWRLVRRAIKEFEVGGYVIPKRSLVICSQFVTHRDDRYFPEPLTFDPNRWLPEVKATRPHYSFFPFGGGPRRCIGEGFAMMEGVLLIAAVAQRWRLRLESDADVQLLPRHMLRPKNPIYMKLERREPIAAPKKARFEVFSHIQQSVVTAVGGQ